MKKYKKSSYKFRHVYRHVFNNIFVNKSIIVGIIIGIVMIIGISVSISSNNNEQVSEIDEKITPIEVPQTGKNITIELSESIGLKTP